MTLPWSSWSETTIAAPSLLHLLFLERPVEVEVAAVRGGRAVTRSSQIWKAGAAPSSSSAGQLAPRYWVLLVAANTTAAVGDSSLHCCRWMPGYSLH